MPIMQDLGTPANNVCIFAPQQAGDPLQLQTLSDFTCPGI